MTVQEVINMAKFGELRNLKLGLEESEAIISYINLGLLELYKRFPLSVKEHVITLADSQEIYTLPEDCMWLVSAYGEVPENRPDLYTCELNINNEDDPLSINTVGWNEVQIPIAVTDAYISLIYAAGPDATQRVIYDAPGIYLTKAVALPPQLIEPLLHYIGYRAHGAMDGSIEAESNTHYRRFDASCAKVRQEGMLTNDNLDMTNRVNQRGYV